MIINGIEHAIRMWIDNENDDTILEEVFSSLEEMNAFIENTWRSSEYVGFSAHFSPVDVINGEPDESVRFIFDVEPYMPLEPSEVEEYYLEIEESFRFSQEISEHFGKNTKFEPRKMPPITRVKRNTERISPIFALIASESWTIAGVPIIHIT